MSPLREPPAAAAAVSPVSLNLGEWRVTDDGAATLVGLGLGSCVALCAHDPQAGVGGMAHMVLPTSRAAAGTAGAQFADAAVPLVIEEMERLGAVRRRIVCYLVGGAHILTNTTTALAQVGERNVEAAHEALRALGLRVRAEDVGGERGRTVRLHIGSGEVDVAHAGAPRSVLSNGRS